MASAQNNIFKLYSQIEPNDYLRKIKFYEEKTNQIFQLEIEQQYFLKYEFVKALFDLGRYEKVLGEIDDLIEYVFLNKTNFSAGDNFEELVFIKGAAHYDLQKIDAALNIAQQLVSMKPHNSLYQQLLLKCYHSQLKEKFTNMRLSAILAILTSATISGIVLLKNGLAQSPYINFSIGINILVLIALVTTYFVFSILAHLKLKQYVKSVIYKKDYKGRIN